MIYKNIECLIDKSKKNTSIQDSTPKVLSHIKEWNVASVKANPGRFAHFGHALRSASG